jgi:PPOX class probable F420-dependent enzyme
MGTVDLELARQRMRDARVGRLGTVTSAGRPHLVPCCFALADEVVYSAVDSKPKSTLALRRIANIVANPAASLLVDHYEDDWSALWWVRADGSARVVDSPPEEDAARALLAAKYAQYRDVAMPGPVIALEIRSWTAWP